MRGNVIGFDPDTNTGAISGHDSNRYDFVTHDWHGRSRPYHGDIVDFQIGGGQRALDIYLVEPEYIAPTLAQFLFSPHGRISRSQYWLKWVLPVIVLFIVLEIVLFLSLPPIRAAVILVICGLALIWPHFAIYIKRAHDRDWPWPFILLLFVPLVQLWPLVELWFLRGSIGTNRFGADPVPRR